MKAIFSAALVILLAVLAATEASAQIHCSELPPLTPDAEFPRCSALELAVAGFPDHKHAYAWPGWKVLTDDEGVTFGPWAMCNRIEVLPRQGLIIEPDRKSYGHFIVQHNPAYKDCDMVQLLEILDWAHHDVSGLLGLDVADTMTVLNPDNTQHYLELTGHGVWRLYYLDGNHCTLEPFPVLSARTLAAHAAFMLVTDWTLRSNLGNQLPPWLHQGIVEYIGESGMHLLSYMGEFREAVPILLSPGQVNALLARGLDPDEGRDRELFRRASYSSFLMVWHLVEQEGGLTSLREFLDLAAGGMDLDLAAKRSYGMDMETLADFLDPVKNGEPLPNNIDRPRPNLPP